MGDEGSGAVGVGSRIAGYHLEEQIGQGGMAVVFRAQDERLERQVALKILSPALATDEAFRHRFIRESRSAAAVDDPHIIPVFEAGDADGMLFIAMRYVPGGDAGTLVRRLGPLPIVRAAAIISAVASALDAAHAAGLVHRDVKPANMLVDARPGRPDHVYLSDFGLTKGALSSASLTGTGQFMGTPTYCAPEQIKGQRVDARTDEYALACAAFVLLSGEPPFPRDEGMAVLYAQLSAPPPLLTSRRPGLPPAVDEVLLRALAKAPEDRYASCGEFADALRMAFGLQRYDCDVAVALHQRSLTDQQHRLGLDHADTLASHASLAAAYQEAEAFGRGHRATPADLDRSAGHAGAGSPGHAGHEVQHCPGDGGARRSCRGGGASSGMCSRPGSGRWAGITRTRWPPGSALPRRWRRAGIMPGRRSEFRDVFAARQRTLGPDHPDTLIAWFSIAQEMAAAGRSCRGGGRVPRDAAAPAAQAGPGSPGHAGHPVQHCPGDGGARGSCRGGGRVPGRAAASGAKAGSRITRSRWSSGSVSPGRWRRAGIMPGRRSEFRDMLPHLRRRLGPDHPDTLAAAEWIDYIRRKKGGRSPETRARG